MNVASRLLFPLALLFASPGLLAQDAIEPYVEYRKRVEAGQNISPLEHGRRSNCTSPQRSAGRRNFDYLTEPSARFRLAWDACCWPNVFYYSAFFTKFIY